MRGLYPAVALLLVSCARATGVAGDTKTAPGNPLIQPFGDGNFVLHTAVVWRVGSSSDSIVVPAGFVTDLASIPGPGRALLHPNGPHGIAAIVHDYLYWNQSCTREEADGLFRLAMMESRVPAAQYQTIYAAVRAGGGRKWDAARREREQGLPHIIPTEFRNIPALARWRHYRTQLRQRGVRAEAGPTISRAACGRGTQKGLGTSGKRLRLLRSTVGPPSLAASR